MENSSSASLEAFMMAVIEELEGRGIKSITITQAPKPYQPYADLISYLLFRSGFVQEKVVSHQFFIGRKKLKKLAQKEFSKLQAKSKNSDLQVSHSSISNFGFLKEIKSWSTQKGYGIAVDEKRIVQQVSEYPHRYFLITLSKNAEPIGYSLGVKLTSNSLYYFLSAINPKITVKNGGELIINELFQLAVEQKVDFNKVTWVKKFYYE